MEFISVLCLCFVLFVPFLSWKHSFFGLSYYFKWAVVYVVLKWNRIAFMEKADVVIFPTKREEYLERPRVWKKQKTFRRDSMLVFAGSEDVWLLLELARGRFNSGAARVKLQLGSSDQIYQSSDQDGRPRACEEWTTDCLAFQCLEPMRRWRIVFSGRLQCKKNNSYQGSKFVKINLIWAALNGPYHYETSTDTGALTCALAERPLSELKYNLESLGKGYEQWGVVQGTVTVDDIATDIHTPSLRRHSWKWPHMSAAVSVVGLADNGTLFSINYNFAKCRTQLGHVRYADGRVETIVGNSEIDSAVVPDKFVRNFSSNCYDHQIYVVRRAFQQWGALQFAIARCTLDSQQASCLVLSWNRTMREELPELPFLRYSAVNSDDLVVSLDHPACSNPDMVGGKAASLALLTDAAQSILRNKMMVPAGFCLTVHAMQLQLKSSIQLIDAVNFLNSVSNGQEEGNLQEHCQRSVSLWLSVAVCPAVVAALTGLVEPIRSYAVRSSALCEDCDDSSAAGQNATVLGCVGVDAVIAAVQKCWASLYTYQSVQYRRQSGLPVESVMGVVVQEMVDAEVAGVMFTRHPVTGDPSQLLITANYGLGETVVSGSVEPDTVIVNTEKPSQLHVEMTIKGHKTTKLTVTEDGGTVEEAVEEDESDTVCLSEAEVVALAQLGVSLEQLFGWPRDVEWAINKGTIYLLQCRPITALLAWSQQELTHELDSAVMPGEVITTANTGEVLPGATSPLTQSTGLRCADFVMIRYFAGVRDQLWYSNGKLVTSHHHTLLSLSNTLMKDATEEMSLTQRVLEMAVCGHRVSTAEMLKTAAARRTPLTLWQKLQTALFIIKQLFRGKSVAVKAQKFGEQFRLDCDNFTSAAALYSYLTASFADLNQVFLFHTRISMASTIWQTVLFSILAEGKSDLSEENMQDIALLLVDKQKALSAHIPADIKKLTNAIKECEKWHELTNLTPEKFPAWMEINCPRASRLLDGITRCYEHRNIKELDLMTRTWGIDNTPLLSMVQTLLRSSQHPLPESGAGPDSDVDVVDQLQSPIKPMTRWLIRRLVGLASSAAARREVTKDASLRMLHQLRLGYMRLAHLMYQEGRLPCTELVWFCTHYELNLLLGPPNPSLLHKISRRQRNWQQWNQLQFPEVMVGMPEPIQLESHPTIPTNEWVQGTLVCPGSVRGRACVLLSCADSSSLRAGDILVTHSTDVGWTPLFPLLGGVVTELGGLISHGAVVAREYGLPCVVGATNATLVFKTGDEVYLDGRSGKVQKISPTS